MVCRLSSWTMFTCQTIQILFLSEMATLNIKYESQSPVIQINCFFFSKWISKGPSYRMGLDLCNYFEHKKYSFITIEKVFHFCKAKSPSQGSHSPDITEIHCTVKKDVNHHLSIYSNIVCFLYTLDKSLCIDCLRNSEDHDHTALRHRLVTLVLMKVCFHFLCAN